MERISKELVVQYGQQLASMVRDDEMSASYSQNLVTSINTVLGKASGGRWESVSPTGDCGIAKRSAIRDTPTPSSDIARSAITALRDGGKFRQASIAELALDLGLRSKEASLLDARSAYAEALRCNSVSISDGTKGGLSRTVPITDTQQQIQTLANAARAQGDARAVMPPDQNWKAWRESGLRYGRETLQEYGIKGYHDLRAAFAAHRYEVITGHPSTCNGGAIKDRVIDRLARESISRAMGHGRIDVTTEYLGGRK